MLYTVPYCAWTLNIDVHLFYITYTCDIYIWFLLLYYKMTKTRNVLKKAKRHAFCFAKYKYVAYLLNQQRQLTNSRMFQVLFFANMSSTKLYDE